MSHRAVFVIALATLLAGTRASAQSTSLVSADPNGFAGNDSCVRPAISADGRWIAFTSFAGNFVFPPDISGFGDVFVRDVETGLMERVSVSSTDHAGNGDSSWPSISADGRYVVFYSDAFNLVPSDTNQSSDVFLRDRMTSQTTRLSVDATGTEGNGDSRLPVITPDGRYVAFSSTASNLVSGDTVVCQSPLGNYDCEDVFVLDRDTGEMALVSVDSAGARGNGNSAFAHISADGRFVAFVSNSDNLVSGDTNGIATIGWDIFVHDRETGETTRVSVDSLGNEANDFSLEPAMSGDGRFVGFRSRATNLVPGDTNGWDDAFVHDRLTGETMRVSVNSNGLQTGTDSGYDMAMSANGRFVAFVSFARNLVADDLNGDPDVFLHDLETRETTCVSVDSAGRLAQSADGSYAPALSEDGRFIAFDSSSRTLVPGIPLIENCHLDELFGCFNVFVRDREPCSKGTVDSGLGAAVSVLRLNGMDGLVNVDRGLRFTLSLDAPPQGPTSALYVLWVWRGLPVRQTSLVASGERLGCTGNPTPFDASAAPQPIVCLRGAGVGRAVCGAANEVAAPPRAPWSTSVRSASTRSTLTLQGAIRDAGAANAFGVSVTNAVFLYTP